jgi:SpoVK/Ycf46/Vps4 family AAA+-type ATPase
MSKVEEVKWEQIAGLEHAKYTITETVILPLKRP